MEKVSVGIIGFGRIGAEHARWLSSAKNARPVAVADATPARQEMARSRGLKVYGELAGLLADSSVDAVVVATPTKMHFEHAAAALEAGKHVMVEKPMALDLNEARKLVELARSRKKSITVFHNRRWDADALTVQKNIVDGVFGKIINIESRIHQWASCVGPAAKEYRPGWRNEAAYGGGGLYDWGSHLVDQLWRVMWPAKAVRVFGQLRGNVGARDCDDFARVIIDFDNDAVGLVEINTTTTRPGPRWHIDGTTGSASSPTSLAYDTAEWARLEFAAVPGNGGTRVLERAPAGLTETEIWERFAATALGQGEPAVKAESVLVTMMLLEAARESSRDGQAVDVSAKVEWVS